MIIEEFVAKDSNIIKSIKDIREFNEYTIRAKIQSRGIRLKDDIKIYIFLVNLPVNNSCEYPTKILTKADFDNSIDFIEVTGTIYKVGSWEKTTLCKYRIVSSDLLSIDSLSEEKYDQLLKIIMTA